MLNSCSSIHVKSQSCIVLFDLVLQQLYGILGQPSYVNIYNDITNRNVFQMTKERNIISVFYKHWLRPINNWN